MHTIQIIWLITWPVSILIAYYAAVKVISFYEKRIQPENEPGNSDNQ